MRVEVGCWSWTVAGFRDNAEILLQWRRKFDTASSASGNTKDLLRQAMSRVPQQGMILYQSTSTWFVLCAGFLVVMVCVLAVVTECAFSFLCVLFCVCLVFFFSSLPDFFYRHCGKWLTEPKTKFLSIITLWWYRINCAECLQTV